MSYNELIKRLREHNGWALNKTLDEAADAIEDLENKLNLLRRRGTWIPFAAHAALGTFVKCSECGQTGDASWKGCPRCLAIMGGNDE